MEKRRGIKDVIKSKVGLISVVGMFYAICCAGAYGIEEMIPECGPGLTIVMLLVLPLVWGLPYALICSELGSARPVEGGSLMWVKEALGEFWFGVMVFSNVIWSLVCNTVYVVLAVSYLGNIIPLTSFESYIIKILMILVFFIINILGIRDVSIVSTVLSVIIVIAFAVVAAVGFFSWNTNPMEPFTSGEYDNVFQTLGAGLAIGIWMYSGFDEMSVMAGEINNAHKIIPKALMIIIPLITLTYVLPTVAGLASVGNWELWTTEPGGTGYSTVLTQNAGPIFGIIFLIVAIIGQCSIFNVCIATGSRCILVLSDENFGPAFIANLTKKRGTPYVGLIIVAAVTMLLIPFDFTFLVVVDVFFMVTVCVLTVTAAMILKRKIPEEEVPFKVPGGRAGHNAACIMVLTICVLSTLVNGTDWYLGGLLWILIIPVLYILSKKKFKGSSVKEPKAYPIDPATGLGFGDLKKIGCMYSGIGIFAILSRFFLQWYEGSWGPEYYLNEYGSGLFSDFGLMLSVITITGIVSLAAGLVFVMTDRRIDKTKINRV